MSEFTKEIEGIYRLRVPFDTVYTSVFLITADKNIMVDCATTKTDVEDYIIPALAALGYAPTDIDVLVLTHNHGDHAGGREYFLAHSPATRVITELTEICGKVSTYPMAGHTEGCIGVMDERTHTLISGDGLQGAGVDKYRCYTQNPSAYLETVKRIEGDGRIENILFSHEYEPWYKNASYGREDVLQVLSDCPRYVNLER